jgi:very-short-patch-repair endonuclease
VAKAIPLISEAPLLEALYIPSLDKEGCPIGRGGWTYKQPSKHYLVLMAVHNRPELKPFRKALRSSGTKAEAALWKMLKGSQLEGRKFRRQHSVGAYVLDFYCPDERLAVELDGAGHFTPEGQAHDATRTAFLATARIKVIRLETTWCSSIQ